MLAYGSLLCIKYFTPYGLGFLLVINVLFYTLTLFKSKIIIWTSIFGLMWSTQFEFFNKHMVSLS